MSTRHVDARTQAVSPELVVLPVKGNVAKLEAAWATRIPELGMEVDMLDARTLDGFGGRKNQIIRICFPPSSVILSLRSGKNKCALFKYEYEKVHVRLQKRRY